MSYGLAVAKKHRDTYRKHVSAIYYAMTKRYQLQFGPTPKDMPFLRLFSMRCPSGGVRDHGGDFAAHCLSGNGHRFGVAIFFSKMGMGIDLVLLSSFLGMGIDLMLLSSFLRKEDSNTKSMPIRLATIASQSFLPRDIVSMVLVALHLGYCFALLALAGPIPRIHVGLISRNELAQEPDCRKLTAKSFFLGGYSTH